MESAKTSTSEAEKEQNPSPVISANPLPPFHISSTHSPPSSSSSKSGKRAGARESGASLLGSVNRSVSQIRKNSLRRGGSPVNWYPRKKGDSYLQRKIKHLQEVGGMNLSLDETLCGANLHYSRIAREKIAAMEAANRAMEARRAAMVEASWCLILKAARIRSKEAEEELSKAEKRLSEALEVAVDLGVMMYDKPGSHSWSHKVETSTSLGKGVGRCTHTITAPFENAFEVEKEVAAAVKEAFLRRVAKCSSNNNSWNKRDEFQRDVPELLHHSDSPRGEGCEGIGTPPEGQRRRVSGGRRRSPGGFAGGGLVDTMFDRLGRLRESELSSLAAAVAATSAAALVQDDDSGGTTTTTGEYQGISESGGSKGLSIASDRRVPSKNTRYSSSSPSSIQGLVRGRREEGTGGGDAQTAAGLDKCLVKHLSRLEREVREARELRRKVVVNPHNNKAEAGDALEEASSSSPPPPPSSSNNNNKKNNNQGIPLDGVLVENVSGLGRNDVQAAKSLRSACVRAESDRMSRDPFKEPTENCPDDASNQEKKKKNSPSPACLPNDDGALDNKENIRQSSSSNRPPPPSPSFQKKHVSRIQRARKEVEESFSAQDEHLGLDRILVKPTHSRLDRMKKQEGCWDLVPKLERNKHHHHQVEEEEEVVTVTSEESLDKVLVRRRVSRLEKEKAKLVAVQPEDPSKCCNGGGSSSSTRRERRELLLQEAWGGLSLGNSLKPPSLSRLEREKAAWRKAAEEEEKKRTVQQI